MVADRRHTQSSSLDIAMERAIQQREIANQKKEDLRIGAKWNEDLKNSEFRADPQNLERLWAEIKIRLIRRYTTIQVAFKTIDNSGDGQISFIEFTHMLQQIHLPLDPRVCRGVFEQASGGDRTLSMEQLKKLLMERTIRKLNFLMDNFNGKQERVQTHIHYVLGLLSESSEVTRQRGVNRFQRKLTVEFSRDLWQALLKAMRKTSAQHPSLERAQLGRVVHSWVGIRLQKYECSFLLRVFDRVDVNKRGIIPLASYITQLVLLSQDQDHGQKIALVFDMFDTDYDGCLVYDQLLEMCKCICAQRPIAEESARASKDLAFQEELSCQEGFRAYEKCRWYLQRYCKVEGGIVSLRELWEALSKQPNVLDDLLPGVVRIYWAMDPSAMEEKLETLSMKQASKERWDIVTRSSTSSALGARMTVTRSSSKLLAAVGRRPTTKETLEALAAASRRPPKSKELEGPATEAVQFKKTVMNKFQISLRSLGEARIHELAAGEIPKDIMSDDDCDSLAGSIRPASPRSPRSPRTGGGLSRVNTAPGRLSFMAGNAPSSPARSMTSQASRPGSLPLGGAGGASVDLPPIDGPMFNADKWGAESADRFRLFCTVKNSFGKYSVNRAEATTGIGYRCQLCGRVHHLNVSCF